MELRKNKNSLEEGYLLHWYEIIKVIGRGGFGITYLAHDKNLDRKVAIKEFMPEDFASRESDSTVHPKTGEQKKLYDWGLERFIAEARTLAKFNHPNIVRVQSVFEENNTAYMVMEYAQGKDLAKVYKKEAKFTEEQLLDTFIPILDGLSLVHNAGFIHRDIKPANIYICDNNSPILLDFGSARQSIGGKTKALTSLVTFGYAPYEQYNEGSGKQGPWTDIYSLGASIYFGITGKKPVDALFRGGSFLEKGIDTYEPASVIAEGEYSENFLLAVDKALMFKIDERPKNILHWADMLLGKVEAPQLPDFMLNPPEDDTTELSWSDTELGYNTEISQSSKSGSQGLVDAQGKRNTGYTQATVVRNTGKIHSKETGQKTALIENVKQLHSEIYTKAKAFLTQFEKPWQPVAVVGSAAVLLIVIVSWIFSDSPVPEIAEDTQQASRVQQEQQENQARQQQKEQQANKNKIKLDHLLSKARQSLIVQNYVTPDKNNAYYFYQQVLTLDANNSNAKGGIENIERELTKLANSAFENSQYKKSQDYLDQLMLVNSKSVDAKFLQDQLNAQRVQTRQIESWLSEAKTHIKNNRYTSPQNKNAYSIYQKVLNDHPENVQALEGIKKIQSYYSTQFKRHISASQLKKAEYDISVMKKISAPASAINEMQRTLKKSQKTLSAKKVAKPKKVVRPKKTTTKKLDIQLASQVIGKFKSALQNRDSRKIKMMSQFVPGREQFVDQLHSQYRSMDVKVSNLHLISKENRTQAHIEISNLVDINGNKIKPGSWSKFDITLRYNKRGKLKVYW